MKFSEERLIAELGDDLPRIKRCILLGVQHYQEKLADESAIISGNTRSNYIRDFIVFYAKREFGNDSSVKIVERKRMLTFIFIKSEARIILKFKKFDKYNRTSYSHTLQAIAFSTQGDLFPEYSRDRVNVHAGYKWNETATEIECMIGLPNAIRGHAWCMLIPNMGEIVTTMKKQEKTRVAKPQVRLKVTSIKSENEKAG